jgi:hypothetical protein
MHFLLKTAMATRLAGATLALALLFLAGCGGGVEDGTTNEEAAKATQAQSDAWHQLKAEGKDKDYGPNAKPKKEAKPFGNYSR